MNYNIDGWVDDPDGVAAVESEVGVFGSAASFLTGTGKDKIVCLYDDWTKLQMQYLYLNQGKIGSCVAEATAGGVDQLKVSEIADGQREMFVGGTVAEAIYYGARVVVGKSRLRGDGAYVASAIKYIYDRGTLARQKYSFADLSEYSVKRCRDWGNNIGVPKELEVTSKEYVIGNYARVRSWEEARDSIANKCPVIFGSSYGFSSETDDEGFCKQNTTWRHAMLLFAIDDHSKRKGGGVCNSWGRNWLKIRKRKLNQPDGSFWADADVIDKIMRNGDAWSICDFKGYKAKIDSNIAW